MKVGNGLESGIQMGPAVSQDQFDTDMKYIKIGAQEGAKLLAGGDTAPQGGYFVQPTVFDHVAPQMRIAQEEVFWAGDRHHPRQGCGRRHREGQRHRVLALSAGIVTNDMHKALSFCRAHRGRHRED